MTGQDQFEVKYAFIHIAVIFKTIKQKGLFLQVTLQEPLLTWCSSGGQWSIWTLA